MDLGFLTEVAAGVVGLLGGLGVRHFWPKRVTKTVEVEKIIERAVGQAVIPTPAISQRSTSPSRATVRFQYADSSADIKTLFKHSLAPEMVWGGKRFKHLNTGKDQIHIYIEQED
jgi:hypothetical protein